MKLIIDLDNRIKCVNHNRHDLVITDQKINKYKCQTIRMNFSLCDEKEDLSDSINNLFDNYLPNEFRYLRNTYFMRVFRPICSLIIQIEELLEKESITELLLIGGSPLAFITLNSGEGEGEKHFYKSSWLFNDFLMQYFNKTIPIRWENKKNKFIFSLLHIIRENTFFYLKLIKNLASSFIFKNSPLIPNTSINESNIFSFVQLPLQFKHLKSLTENLNLSNNFFISSFNSIVSKGKKSNIYTYKVSFSSTLRSIKKFKNLKFNIKSQDFIFRFQNKNISLNKNIFIRSLMNNFIFFQINLTSLMDLFKRVELKNKAYFFGNMTVGEDVILVYELSRKLNIPFYNFQAVTMSKIIFPQMNLAERYFLYSKKTHHLYEKFNSSYEFYLPFFQKKYIYKLKEEDTVVLTLFTQPDTYTDRYIDFLNLVLPLLSRLKTKVRLNIKLHYREHRINEFIEISNQYEFVEIIENLTLVESVIKKSHFILSMTSSVLYESIVIGRPGIIIDFDGQDFNWIYDNDICYPEINFIIKSANDLFEILNHTNKYSSLYNDRRDEWLLSNKSFELKTLVDVS